MSFTHALWYDLDAVFGLERFNPFRDFRNTCRRFDTWLGSRSRKAGLKLITQGSQFGQIGVVEEGLAETLLGSRGAGTPRCQGLGGHGRIRNRSIGQAFHGVQDGARFLVPPQEAGPATGSSFQPLNAGNPDLVTVAWKISYGVICLTWALAAQRAHHADPQQGLHQQTLNRLGLSGV
jgi:hypothetical protein